MQQFELKISNINNDTYPDIILRKFFNMVFVSSDGKRLCIYTATVFGGVKKESSKAKTTSSVPGASYLNQNTCSLKFEYNKDECIKSVNIFDLTERLWAQPDCMGQVWGKCEKISTQTEFNNILKKINPESHTGPTFNMEAKWPAYYIYEDGKPYHECLVVHALFEKLPDSDTYALHSQKDMQCEGLEFMSWIKTEINLSTSILNKTVKFKISLDGNQEHSYYTPDFTWYFAPPSGYCVDEDSATANFGQEKKRNIIQSVTGDTTVHFKEWEDDEKIDDRKKARVYLSQYTANDPCILSKNRGIEVTVLIKNPHQFENRQFFIGLLVAFLLSFCSDKTRLNDYFACIEQMCSCTADGSCACSRMCNAIGFLFPCLVILAYIAMMFDIKRCLPAKRKKRHMVLKAVRVTGFVVTMLVLCYVFGIWLIFPEFMQSILTCGINQFIIWSMTVSGGICNIIYVGYCIFIRKKKVYDYI